MDVVSSQLAERVRAAVADQIPLRIRGAGSKDFHGRALHGELLHTQALHGIRSYEPSELVITARAGTPLAELEAALAEHGQCLPFEPPHFAGGATVGGMVAAGLSGPARASVGAVRDYVLGVTLLNGHAQWLRFGGKVMKNVAGYDVSRLMCGAWGTLGVLGEVSLKVMPLAPGEATLRFECDQAQALRLLHGWGGQPLPLNASCWLPQTPVAACGTRAKNAAGVLTVRLRGAQAAVAAACKAMGGTRLEQAGATRDWVACRDHTLPWFTARAPGMVLWRLSVPATAPVMDMPQGAAPLVEWHGALRWVHAPVQAGPALQAAALAVGGSASVFAANHPEDTWASAQFGMQSDALAQLHQRIKHSFDPAGVFNPGRVSAQW